MRERANDRGEELLEGRVKSLSYTFHQCGSWLRSWSRKPGLVNRDDERIVVEYERCLSDCSQDGMNDRKREALIWCAWLVWYIHQEMFVGLANHYGEILETHQN